jgi:prepilin-type processing-associated H-X9-DG protein
MFPSYGFNWFYLAPDSTWDATQSASAASSGRSRGLPLTGVVQPAETVLLVDSTYGDPADPTNVGMGYYTVNPPALWTGAPPITRSSYGFVWPRHHNSATTLYVDGHARLTSIDRLKNPGLWDRD